MEVSISLSIYMELSSILFVNLEPYQLLSIQSMDSHMCKRAYTVMPVECVGSNATKKKLPESTEEQMVVG